MAILTNEQAIKLMEKPRNGASLIKAVEHEQSIRVHTEPIQFDEEKHRGHTLFLRWVQSILNNNEKFRRFKQYLTYPLSTNELTESIFDKLSRVFDSQNSFNKYNFSNPEHQTEFLNYLSDTNDSFFWRHDVWETVMNRINSVLVIDMRTSVGRPQPYSFIVNTENIIDIDNSKVTTTLPNDDKVVAFKTEYLIVRHMGDIFVYDDISYRKYERPDKEDNDNWIPKDPTPTIESRHDLGYCPAKQIWTNPFSSKDKIRKSSPLSKIVGDLDKMLYFMTAQEYLRSYITNPVIIEYAVECDYVADNGVSCESGYLINEHQSDSTKTFRVPCPKCTSDLVGPGTIRSVLPPQDKEEFDQSENAIRFVQPPLEGLKNQSEDILLRKKSIEAKTVGIKEGSNDQAKNELHIQGQYLNEEQMLRTIAVNLEIIKKFDHDTKARLMFNTFQSSSVFMGSKWILSTTQEMVDSYKSEKESGVSEFELSISRDKITQSKHKHNPDLLSKSMLLSQVEPYQGQSIMEITDIKKDLPNLIADVDYVIKLNFNTFVNRYEREEKMLHALINDNEGNLKNASKELDTKFREYATEIIGEPEGQANGGG